MRVEVVSHRQVEKPELSLMLEMVEHMVDGDPMDPGREFRTALEPREPSMDLQEDVLRQVASHLLLPGHPIDQVQHPFRVRLVQLFECHAITWIREGVEIVIFRPVHQ